MKQLKAMIDRLRDRSIAIVLITHRLSEVIELTESVVVMRNGRVTWRSQTSEVDVSNS